MLSVVYSKIIIVIMSRSAYIKGFCSIYFIISSNAFITAGM